MNWSNFERVARSIEEVAKGETIGRSNKVAIRYQTGEYGPLTPWKGGNREYVAPPHTTPITEKGEERLFSGRWTSLF